MKISVCMNNYDKCYVRGIVEKHEKVIFWWKLNLKDYWNSLEGKVEKVIPAQGKTE